MHWDVIAVQTDLPLGLAVGFANRSAGKVRFEPADLTGVFEGVRDPQVFIQVFVDHGGVAWRANIDPGPDAMYAEIKPRGDWALR